MLYWIVCTTSTKRLIWRPSNSLWWTKRTRLPSVTLRFSLKETFIYSPQKTILPRRLYTTSSKTHLSRPSWPCKKTNRSITVVSLAIPTLLLTELPVAPLRGLKSTFQLPQALKSYLEVPSTVFDRLLALIKGMRAWLSSNPSMKVVLTSPWTP